jgi:hypothetical protein
MTYKYTGNGYEFIAGVPARDLTEAEFKELPQAQQDECIKSGLYVLPANIKNKKPSAQKAEIDLSDGVDDDEARLAGQALAARKTNKVNEEADNG